MQFAWRYVDDLIGKGLSLDVLAQFFYYAGLTLIPMSLPLAVLLASLITFGNLGERFELLAMKAAGIPLLRILQPMFLFAVLLSIGSFYFQNVTSPNATKQLGTLVYSMKQKSPELDIPEGVFYNEIPGFNIFIERKNKKTGILYGVMIYSNTEGYEDAQIVLADSAHLQMTADKTHLTLTLYNGERFRNMQTQGGIMSRTSVPYMRETFIKEVDIINFDANFNMMDASLFSSNAATKNLKEIKAGIDSLSNKSDSIGREVFKTMSTTLYAGLPTSAKKESEKTQEKLSATVCFDSLFNQLPIDNRQEVVRTTYYKCKSALSEYEFRALVSEDLDRSMRLHWVEMNKKFTLSLACIIFFFIGAPLGAIIRRGGLGVPVIVSVAIFIFYYIINVSGEKLAKTGDWQIWLGIWMSSMILFPIGGFLIYKANKDSVVFNIEAYRNFFMRLLGLRLSRHISRKEVVISDPNYEQASRQLALLATHCGNYTQQVSLRSLPNYLDLFFRYSEDTEVISLNERMETLIEELGNSKDNLILSLLNELPILSTEAHTRPFRHKKWNITIGLLLPIGLFFYVRIWCYRLRLYKDMQQIQECIQQINKRIDKILKNK